jgi:hypothetical protein
MTTHARPLRITRQPQATPPELRVGDSVAFHVEIEGGTPPYTFKWNKDDTDAPGAFEPTTETTSTYSIPKSDINDAGLYSVVVSDSGTPSAASASSDKSRLASDGVGPVFFYYMKDGQEKDCTPSAIAVLRRFLEADTDTAAWAPATAQAAVGPLGGVESGEDAEEADGASAPWDIATIKAMLAEKLQADRLNLVVSCPDDDGSVVLTDNAIREAIPGVAYTKIELLPPTPAEAQLIEASKGITGLDALKSSTSTAVLVIANISLVTAVVTTLGLVKADEIGSKLNSGWKLVLLLTAVLFGVLAIGFALWAQAGSKQDLDADDLVEVRSFIAKNTRWRMRLSIWSLIALILAMGFVTASVAYAAADTSAQTPTGDLSVDVTPPSTFSVSGSWSDAPADSVARLTIANAAAVVFARSVDVSQGAAKLDAAQTLTPPVQGTSKVQIRLMLITSDKVQEKDQCARLRSGSTPTLTDC